MPQINNENQGCVLISRNFLDCEIMTQKQSILKVFLYLLLKSNHKGMDIYGLTTSNYGEYKATLDVIAGELATTAPTVGKCLKWLEKNGYIEKIGTAHGTHIRIVNYDKYQIQPAA